MRTYDHPFSDSKSKIESFRFCMSVTGKVSILSIRRFCANDKFVNISSSFGEIDFAF